jgi:hypothetical protein
MDNKIIVEELDQKMQKNGWNFKGVILNYKNAFKEQASIYEKDGKYVVSGIDSRGKKDLFETISKKEAEKRIKESIKEISKYMFRQIE